MLYRLRLLLAKWLATIRLHRHDRISGKTDRETHQKSRTAIAGLLIPPGNLYLCLQRSPSRILCTRDWIAWELEVAQKLNRHVRELGDRSGIEAPWIPGVSLKEFLRGTAPRPEKRQAIHLAARALRQLHQCQVSRNDVQSWPLSHGDAVSQNVVIDMRTSSAHWVDFDMSHGWQMPASVRHADDLRALIWSIASDLEQSDYRSAAEAARDGYADSSLFREVQQLTKRTACPTVFQLAQAPLSPTDFTRLVEVLHDVATEPS